MSRSGDILVLDDDSAIRTVVAHALRRAGHRVRTTASLAEFNRELRAAMPDVVVSDVVPPDGNGLDMVAGLVQTYPQLPVIVLSAQNTLTTAVRATEVGAYDYLPKPFDLDDLTRAVDGALGRQGGGAAEKLEDADRALPLIGRSPAMQDVYRVIARVISNDLTVLISGE
jgi:two-component system nitrogen regulation response regulator GlnG